MEGNDRGLGAPIIRTLWVFDTDAVGSRNNLQPAGASSSGSRGDQQPARAVSGGFGSDQRCAAAIRLEELPNNALELIAQHASSSSTPAACLLPLVCSGWGTAVDSVQLLVDITVDLGPQAAEDPDVDLDAVSSVRGRHSRRTRAGPAAAATVAAAPPVLLRGRQLAAWLAKRRGSVRSLRIPGGSLEWRSSNRPGWRQDLIRIRNVFTVQQRVLSPGAILPHLVRLELPVVGLPGSATFMEALAGCPSLQRLTLGPCERLSNDSEPFTYSQAAQLVGHLTQLRALDMTLHMAEADSEASSSGSLSESGSKAGGSGSAASLMRQLPASLEEVAIAGPGGYGSHCKLPLSSITHLVKLRVWEHKQVKLVVDDCSPCATLNSSSSSSSSPRCGVTALTALTRLYFPSWLKSTDARLRLPNLRALCLSAAQYGSDAWQQLVALQHVGQLTVVHWDGPASLELGGWTQLQSLVFQPEHRMSAALASSRSWADVLACLTRLTVLHLPAHFVLAGGSGVLVQLPHLTTMTVYCVIYIHPNHYPYLGGAQGWVRTPAGGVVAVVAEAVADGWQPLQRLVLLLPPRPVKWQDGQQQVAAAARAALPGVEVEVGMLELHSS